MGRGAVQLWQDKTDDPRTWALNPGDGEALRRWKKRFAGCRAPSDPALVDRFGGTANRVAALTDGIKVAALTGDLEAARVASEALAQLLGGQASTGCEASAWVVLTFLLSRFRVGGTGPRQTIDASLRIQGHQPPAVEQGTSSTTARDLVRASALVGFAVDVSGSMATSIRNNTGGQLSRMKSFERSLDRLLRDAERAANDASRRASSSVQCFAYAFGVQGLGVCDLFAAVQAGRDLVPKHEVERLKAKYEAEICNRYQQYAGVGDLLGRWGLGGIVGAITEEARTRGEAEVRDRIMRELSPRIEQKLAAVGDTTLTLEDLAELWRKERGSLDDADGILFGDTPMRRGLTERQKRFEREASKHAPGVQRVAFVLSDGESTDGDPREPVRCLKEQGVTIVSCFLTDADIADPRVV
ncbi:VWA domain-containing protein [Sorangium sp. So ce385]|uniref:VWA domain-containing protein n=1 Tax=Sorangium sp. So ce385 TaxID=3133308 RepID=UPI003F5B2D97